MDPIEGQLGALVLSGWIAYAPTGREEAYLLLTTPHPAAPVSMTTLARALDLEPGQVRQTRAAAVEIGDDLWATLLVGDGRHERPVTQQWRMLALDRHQVVLVVGLAAMPAGMDVDTYTDMHGGSAAIGLVACRQRGRYLR